MTKVKRIDLAVELVAERYGVTTEQIKGIKQTSDISHARHLAIWIAYQLPDDLRPSGQLIGDNIGGRSYQSVLHANRKFNNKRAKNSTFRQETDQLYKDYIKRVSV